MATLKAQMTLPSSYLSSPSIHRGGRFHASLHAPINRGLPELSLSKLSTIKDLVTREEGKQINIRIPPPRPSKENNDEDLVSKLYAIAEAAADRAEMHANIGEQRNNWNTVLLSSINSITLTASIMAGLSDIQIGGATPNHLAFKLSSVLLFTAATGLSLVLNKIQPSQLVEEQRKATRLFRQLEKKIQTTLAIRTPSRLDVEDAMERVLALDKAYPLALLGTMLEKFPETVKPAVWWPKLHRRPQQQQQKRELGRNGWNEELEQVMMSVLEVVKGKDKAEYLRLGNVALTINRVLAISGPLLTAVAAIATGLIDPTAHAPWPMLLGVVGGALATVINTLEHGGQVGMVFELYRNCAGSYQQLEEEIEANLNEGDVKKRENGELFELKVALELGRSLSELRSVGDVTPEFAGKLF